jgi:hypothetical protein
MGIFKFNQKKKKDGVETFDLDYKAASFMEMMRYSTKFDWFLVIIGIFSGCIQGMMPSMNTIIFRGITNTLIEAQSQLDSKGAIDMPWFKRTMLMYISLYFVQAIVAFLSGYCTVSTTL